MEKFSSLVFFSTLWKFELHEEEDTRQIRSSLNPSWRYTPQKEIVLQPVRVDKHSVIPNKTPFSTQESGSRVLLVIVTDCGGKESSPVLVIITMLPRC